MRSTRRQVGLGTISALAGATLVAAGCGPDMARGTQTTTTRLMVRAVAKDAKVIGDGVGGAKITVRNAETGEVLAEGVQRGGTGDTQAIMKEPRPRGLTAYGSDPEAAGFLAELSLTEPTRVEVTAEGPLEPSHARQTTSKTLLLVPGHHIVGEGVILELNGFRVELLEPTGDAPRTSGEMLDVRARVTMMCGCPTEPGGLWDSSGYTIVARLVGDGGVVQQVDLGFSGETSVFEGRLPLESPGTFALEVFAVDETKRNTGMARRELEVAG